MNTIESSNISQSKQLAVVGISYHKADAVTRGKFSLDKNQKASIYKHAKSNGIQGLLIFSTCNRTEIYGLVESTDDLITLLCNHSKGTTAEFNSVGYIYSDVSAIDHMFKVGSGLNSQILGDFEIIGQIKDSARFAKKNSMLNAYLERLVNSVVQASKRIKNETKLCSGTTSVSFAAVQYILEHVQDVENKNILLLGAGKIGRNTCENLVKHSKNKCITLINRSHQTAQRVANKFQIKVKSYDRLDQEILQSDIVIVATASQEPIISSHNVPHDKKLLIIDLSIPKNVDVNVKSLPYITSIHLDDLSRITDKTLQDRKLEIPYAESIITSISDEFLTWVENRKFAPTIRALKQKLDVYKVSEIENSRKKWNGTFNEAQAEMIGDRLIQKITNQFAHHLNESELSKNESLELIKKIFQL